MEEFVSLSEAAGSIMICERCRQLAEIHHPLRENHRNPPETTQVLTGKSLVNN